MFTELMPLLSHRTLILTVSRVDGDAICVNVIPKALSSAEKESNTAVTTPLSISGAPEEIDRELPKQLVEFVASHLQLTSTLRSAKEEMEASAKAARDSARKSASTRQAATTSKAKQDSGAAAEDGVAATTTDASTSPTAAPIGSLFDTQLPSEVTQAGVPSPVEEEPTQET